MCLLCLYKLFCPDHQNIEEDEEEKIFKDSSDEECDDCCICFEPLEYKPKMELECGHIIHTSCGIPWISQYNSCPLCRAIATTPITHGPTGIPGPTNFNNYVSSSGHTGSIGYSDSPSGYYGPTGASGYYQIYDGHAGSSGYPSYQSSENYSLYSECTGCTGCPGCS